MELGSKATDGFTPGTNEWFKAIDNGTIPTLKIEGVITRTFMSGHNDFAEFEIESNGIMSTWNREGDTTKYIEGRKVVLKYAEQKLKNGSVIRHTLEVYTTTD